MSSPVSGRIYLPNDLPNKEQDPDTGFENRRNRQQAWEVYCEAKEKGRDHEVANKIGNNVHRDVTTEASVREDNFMEGKRTCPRDEKLGSEHRAVHGLLGHRMVVHRSRRGVIATAKAYRW